uniref:Uncharacterized protein n=1 Tax=Arundo donax TaxID=35708 RepID=A0A0A9H903_ARUDO
MQNISKKEVNFFYLM